MSLVVNLTKNASGIWRKSTDVGFSTVDHPGDIYARNGYQGIYRTLYGAMSDQQAMTSAAVFGGIKIISEDIGSLAFHAMRRNGVNREVAEDHSLYPRLHDSPNPDMTAMEFREALTAHALLGGSGYAGIERRNGQVIAMWPWQPYEVRRDKDSRGRRVFLHREGGGTEKTHASRDVFQLNGFGMTGNGGASFLQHARRMLNLTLSTEEYASRFFSQDQTPPLVLHHPGKLGSEGVEGVKEAWRKSRQGPDKYHTPAVLQEGMKAELLNQDNQKAQLLEARAFQLLEVCRWLRLSPHKLADMGRATWGNVEQLNINHYNETLRPWCERWEQACKHWLLYDEPRMYVKHNIGGFLRGDFRTQTEGFAKLILTGVYSVNEVRALMDMNPVEDGDKHYIPINMAAVTDAANALSATSGNTPEQPKTLAQIEEELKAQPDLMVLLAGRNGTHH